jgi:hypothetical protein
MARIMYDSVNPFAIPEHAQMVLVYVDGIYKWSQAGRDRFKYAQQITCSAIGAVTAQVGDVEKGCIWPVENAVGWVLRARADGYDPTVYVNERNDWGPCRDAFRRAGVPEPHWWVANYNGIRDIPAGSVGRQYAHPSTPPGNPQGPWHTAGHWDESWIADYWPGVDDNGGPGGGGGGSTMTVEIVKEGIKSLLDGMQNGSEKWAKDTLQGLVVSSEITVTPDSDDIDPDTGAPREPWKDQLGSVVAAIDRRLVRVEKSGTPVTLSESDREDIAGRVRLGLLEDLAPLFALAERLKD